MDPLRIAIAEDVAPLRDLVCQWLSAVGHHVTPVADGRALVHVCRTSPIDLVVSDVQMPHLDGLTAATLVRHEFDLPAVLTSGSWSDVERVQAKTIGAVVLDKPFCSSDLVSAVARVSAGRSRRW